MADYEKEITRKRAEAFRTQLGIFHSESDLTETEVAAHAGVSQSLYSLFLIQNSGKNLPAFLIPFLPPVIREGLLSFLCKESGGTFAKQIPLMKNTNGVIDDEVKDMLRVEGRIIELFEAEPAKALKLVAELKEVIARMEKEIETKAHK